MIDMKNNTINGMCSNCGECCSDILPLSTREITKIDMYIKKKAHLYEIRNNHEAQNEAICPFRNDRQKKCDIYEVRPYICQAFKCDTQPEQAEWRRDEISRTRRPMSMKELFFKDNSTIEIGKENGIKIYKRGEK